MLGRFSSKPSRMPRIRGLPDDGLKYFEQTPLVGGGEHRRSDTVLLEDPTPVVHERFFASRLKRLGRGVCHPPVEQRSEGSDPLVRNGDEFDAAVTVAAAPSHELAKEERSEHPADHGLGDTKLTGDLFLRELTEAN